MASDGGVMLIVAAGINLLALMWLAAGMLKLRQLDAFVDASFGIVPGFVFPIVPVGARVLPFVELIIGITLLIPGVRTLALLVSSCILIPFLALLLWARAVGIRSSCACFGPSDDGPIDLPTLARTGALCVVSLVLLGYFAHQRGASSIGYSKLEALQSVLLAILAAASAVVLLAAIRLLTTIETAIAAG